MKKLFTFLTLLFGAVHSTYAQEPYAVLSNDNTTLAFYYDTDKEKNDGMDVGPFKMDYSTWPYTVNSGWYDKRETITTVVFDDSFADYLPSSTFCWFYSCSNLATINGIENLKTSNVIDMSWMFYGCKSLMSLDVSHFDTSNVTNMSYMFYDCGSLTSLDASNFNTSNVTDMGGMFQSCDGLTSLDISHFDTSNVTNMTVMFNGCSALTSLDLSHFETSKVKDMSMMFSYCHSLTHLDVSHFDTRNVMEMYMMFNDCWSLTYLDVSHFYTSNVANFNSMFHDCNSLTSLDVSHFNTSNATSIAQMFKHCESLTTLDLSHFDTSNVTNMEEMFMRCSALKTIYVSVLWSTQSVTSGRSMFYDCKKLTGGEGTKHSINWTDYTYARIDGGVSAPGYFTYSAPTPTPVDPTPGPSPEPIIGSKRLKTIIKDDGRQKEVAELRYDDTGRIKEYLIDGEIYNRYSYTDNTITITENGDSYSYSIADGKIVSGKTFLDGDYVNIDRTFTYNSNAQLVSIVNSETEQGHQDVYTTTESWEWNGDNLSSWSEVDEEDTETSSFTYCDITAEPVMRALFGFSQKRNLDDFYEIIAIYPYLGTLPKNLFKNVKHKDSENRDRDYNYSYELNGNGDVYKVTLSFNDKIYIYTFEWEGSDAPDPVNPDPAPTPEPITGSKRLKTIIKDDGKQKEVAELRYDNVGRIKEYLIDGETYDSYSYTDNTITITEGGDSYSYTIADGRVVSGKTFLDGDYVNIDRTFTYNSNAQLVSIVNSETEQGSPDVYTATESWEWNGDNLSLWSEVAGVDIETSSFTYSDITAEPVMRALFGFCQKRNLDDFYEILAIYPYLGTLPKNLFKNVKHKDSENRDRDYNYNYELNGNGDVYKVTLSFNDKTYIYTFEWESSDVPPSRIYGVTIKTDGMYYNLLGRRVEHPSKGIYIKDGKKVLVK